MECYLTKQDFLELTTSSPEETAALGAAIGRLLLKVRQGPGSVIALRVGLGAGKTCLVKGIAQGLGIAESVTSPTYTIVCEYPGTVPLYHIDAYRLNSDDDFENTGAGEYLDRQGIVVIEWSERLPHSIPADAITIAIGITGPQTRSFRISGIEPALITAILSLEKYPKNISRRDASYLWYATQRYDSDL
jgi:tRNA threonylcarbamoyladenosine biosynthesis protein TsaE